MSQEKRINVAHKDKGIVMRVTVTKAVELIQNEGFQYTTKAKLHSYLVRQGKLTRNFDLLKRHGVDLNKENEKKNLFRLPSGKIHLRFSSTSSIGITRFQQHLIISYPD